MVLQSEITNEEYKIWKKNTPFLYDIIMCYALEWPSLTVQWLPGRVDEDGYSRQKVILGTHTSQPFSEPNFLMVVEVLLPLPDTEIDIRKYDSSHQSQGGFGTFGLNVVQKLSHQGEINRARYCPFNPDIVATKSLSGPVNIYALSQHPKFPSNMDDTVPATPDIVLKGNDEEGFGLAWSPLEKSYIASGGDDRQVFVWDIEGHTKKEMDPLVTVGQSEDVIQSVQWHHHHKSTLGTAGDDRCIRLFDIRDPSKAQKKFTGHSKEINSLSFNPHNEFLFASGSADHTVKVWDIRNPKEALHTFESHTGEVYTVSWSPFNEGIIASGSADRRVMLWDMSRIGAPQSPEEKEDGPPELLFIHGGHTSKVSDLSWNPNDGEEWVLSCVGEDNVLQVWQMTSLIYETPVHEEESNKRKRTDSPSVVKRPKMK